MLEGDDRFIWLFVEKYYHQILNTPQDTVYHQFSVLRTLSCRKMLLNQIKNFS
jgi:hypothetical protein